jgi:hypothetical protein
MITIAVLFIQLTNKHIEVGDLLLAIAADAVLFTFLRSKPQKETAPLSNDKLPHPKNKNLNKWMR